ncbi:MAG TPA: preprotein translocase subunit SecE [Alphaproteobacteria bacterium]|nr:preprotein translocase subunit SecE [Alphaproteobacteria bacterium]
MAKTSPIQFFEQVKSEVKKVTWPSRKETTVSTIAVFVMVTLASLFLFFADQILAFLVNLILTIGN